MNISDWQADDLADLHRHWGEVYVIKCDGETWSASPVTDMTVILTAESAGELRQAIRRDYGSRPSVQRQPRDHNLGKCWCGETHAADS
jgi:hypothetical protein